MKPSRFPVNYGRQSGFPSTPVIGGFQLTNNVQLISERVDHPQQWVITLAPITLQRAVGVLPWLATFDGQVGVLPPTVPNNVPIVGVPSVPFRVLLAWGAGGVRYQTVFDYPVAGGTFGLLADTLDLNVVDPVLGTTTVTTLDDTPVFAAFMAPGSPGGHCTMMLSDRSSSAGQAIGQFAFWSIKPFARRLWMTQLVYANANVPYLVEMSDAGGTPLFASAQVTDGRSFPQPIPVPSGSALLKVTNLAAGGAGQIFRPLWEIELS